MRKPWLIKSIFAAAVIVTVIYSFLAADEIFRFFTLEITVSSLVTALIPDVVCPVIMWRVYYSLTHDSLGNKIKPPAEIEGQNPPPNKPVYDRFVFDEDFFCEKMSAIAKRFDLKFSYDTTLSCNYGDEKIFCYKAALTGKCNFEFSFQNDRISIAPVGLNVHNCYKFSYSFELLDDFWHIMEYDIKRHGYVNADRGFENAVFPSDIIFNNMSDDEIFDVIEKIIEALYGATSMTYETAETEEGKENFTFYLDAHDYYGYTETTEIGNFKFILNGGKQNV